MAKALKLAMFWALDLIDKTSPRLRGAMRSNSISNKAQEGAKQPSEAGRVDVPEKKDKI